MRKPLLFICGILLLTVSANASPARWEGNGHWYEVVTQEPGLDWEAARDLAEAAGGHLVTITSAEENEFVWGTLGCGDNNYGYNPKGVCWLGLYQAQGTGNSEDRYYTWIDGTPMNLVLWGPGEPNNVGGAGEDCVHNWIAVTTLTTPSSAARTTARSFSTILPPSGTTNRARTTTPMCVPSSPTARSVGKWCSGIRLWQ